jgi:hypothetical protein
MPRYLAEGYAPDPNGDPAVAFDGVRLLESIYLPEDELGLYLFEARSAADVQRAAEDAHLVIDRIRAVRP